MQCPYIYQNLEMLKEYCKTHQIPVSLIEVDSIHKAKELPCVFNSFGVFYKGKFKTVNLLNIETLKKILKS